MLFIVVIGFLWKVLGKDGMFIVFLFEFDFVILDVSDFKIKMVKGNLLDVDVVILCFVIEVFELRMVLLIGEFGNYFDDEFVEVSIIGDLLV